MWFPPSDQANPFAYSCIVLHYTHPIKMARLGVGGGGAIKLLKTIKNRVGNVSDYSVGPNGVYLLDFF